MPDPDQAGRKMTEDTIFANADATAGSFEFNADVAAVFPDMLERSIPGYATTIQAIGALAGRYVLPDTRCYDLGCSLGAATLAMRRGIGAADCEIIAVDNAPAMIQRCRATIAADDSKVEVQIVEDDIRNIEIARASMVVMNYTLQFLPAAGRDTMIRNIRAGMIDGGVFVLSEKVLHEDEPIEDLLAGMHHQFKRQNAYSDLEISRKRTALEDVLIPESIAAHCARLRNSGFRHVDVWLKHFNFASILAIA
jgi:tRNA (cmo5U34)-methyltransferase